MTKPRFVAAVGGVLVVLSLAVLTASAQRPGGNAASQSGIALLDVNRVFKNHGRFQQMMADMKTDLQAEEEMVRRKRKRSLAKWKCSNRSRPVRPITRSASSGLLPARLT